MGRKQAREGAMKLLFQMDKTDNYSDESFDIFLENFSYDESETEYIIKTVKDLIWKKDEIDGIIEEQLKGWSINRLASVDLAVLRIAIYEIIYREDIPKEVSINEAIETTKKYSSEDSYKFVNGVLGSFVRSRGEE